MPELLDDSSASAVRQTRLLGAILILAAVIAYLPAFSAGFIWDDDLLLTANTQLRNLHGLTDIWLGKNTCDYTPLTLTTFWLEKRLWGDAPMGYHFTNILLHAAAGVLLWRILSALRIPGSWLAAFLFVIHPVNVASVAWIAERKNTLSAVFYFGSILLFLTAQRRSDLKCLWASIAVFLLAGLSKGSVVTLPMVLIGCLLWANRKITRRDIVRLIPFFAIAAIISWLTIRYQGGATDYKLAGAGLASRAVRAGYLPWFYLRELFLPIGLSPMTPVIQPDLRSPLICLLPLLMLLAAAALFIWKSRSWGRPLLFASGYYLWMLAPVLGLIWMAFQQEASTADWWQYLAAPGIFALVAGLIVTINRAFKSNIRLGWQLLVCVAMSLLLVQTWRRCAIYHSMESYCRSVLAETPHSWTLQNNLGIILKQQGDLKQAAACYRAALSDNPRFPQAHNNLGNLLSAQEKWSGAERQFKAALEFEPSNGEVLANLSDNYFRRGRIREAFAANAQAIKADPWNWRRYAEFGAKLNANRQFGQAAVCFRNALVLDPEDTRIEIELVRTLIAAGQKKDAAVECEQVFNRAQASGDKSVMHTIAMLREQCGPWCANTR